MTRIFAPILVMVSFLALPAAAQDTTHIVADGQNLGMIARRYHTTAEAIRKHNHLGARQLLRVGQKLKVPESAEHRRWLDFVDKSTAPKEKEKDDATPKQHAPDAKAGPSAPSRAVSPPVGPAKPVAPPNKWARVGHKSGRVAVVRNGEKYVGPLTADGKLLPKAAERLDALLRARRSGARTTMDRRLLGLLADVSDHFGGRTLIIISGFRPHSAKQFTKSSRHNSGKAIDLRVVGVPNEELHAFCKTLRAVGCGYYPNSTFVHLDVRAQSTEWTDYSKPGEKPIYARKRPRGEDAPAVRDEAPKAKEDKADKAAPKPAAPKDTSHAEALKAKS